MSMKDIPSDNAAFSAAAQLVVQCPGHSAAVHAVNKRTSPQPASRCSSAGRLGAGPEHHGMHSVDAWNSIGRCSSCQLWCIASDRCAMFRSYAPNSCDSMAAFGAAAAPVPSATNPIPLGWCGLADTPPLWVCDLGQHDHACCTCITSRLCWTS